MIREATKDDCINLAVLSLQVWLETYAVEGIRTEYSKYVLSTFTESYFLDLLNNSNYRLLLSEIDDTLQGYALINLKSCFKDETNGFEIDKLYVHNKFNGQGVGRNLLYEVEQRYGGRFWLYTWTENTSNKFYQHLGFNQIGKLDIDFNGNVIENNVYGFNRNITSA